MKNYEVTLLRQPGQWERQVNPNDCESIAKGILFLAGQNTTGHFLYKDSQTDETLVDCQFKLTKNFCTLEFVDRRVKLAFDKPAGRFHELGKINGYGYEELHIATV